MAKAAPSINVKQLRDSLNLSQPKFALRFGFSLGTLRQWEQGRRKPDSSARVLLAIIAYDPEVVDRARSVLA